MNNKLPENVNYFHLTQATNNKPLKYAKTMIMCNDDRFFSIIFLNADKLNKNTKKTNLIKVINVLNFIKFYFICFKIDGSDYFKSVIL